MGDTPNPVRLSEREIELAVCDGFAQGVVKRCVDNGSLAAMVRMVGSQIRIACPQGFEAELARMLYRAADMMADRIAPEPKVKH